MKTVFLSSILGLLFMLFTSHLDEHDLLFIMHSHQTTSHSHQEHHKSQVSASVTVRRIIVASPCKNFLSEKISIPTNRLLLDRLADCGFVNKTFFSPIPLNQFTRLRI